jgi:histidinol-phosphate aminotransferase
MDDSDLAKFIRTDIAKMASYAPAPYLSDLEEKYACQRDEILKLDQGENIYGPVPGLGEALSRNGNNFNLYPDPEYKKLRSAIGKYVGVDREYVMVGSGADELLDLILRLILGEGDEVIYCPPTYGMGAMLISLNKGRIVAVPRNDDFSLNIRSIKDRVSGRTKAILICSPNNPTGNTAAREEIEAALSIGKPVIIDEAYFEFCDKTSITLLHEHRNLIILRTFSKWAGLAGLRLGYAVMDPYFIDEIFKIKLPFNVNAAAEIGGLVALDNLALAEAAVRKIISERERIYGVLNDIPGFTVYPSEANFLFIRTKHNLSALKSHLENNRIFPRYYEEQNAIRLTIGKPDQNDKVVACLRSFKKPEESK